MIKSGSRTGGTGPVMKKRGGALKKAGGGGVNAGSNAGSHAGSHPNPGQKAGSGGSSGFSLPKSAWDTRSDIQRFADNAKKLTNWDVGNNATVKIGGSLSSPSVTYTKRFKKGGAIKKAGGGGVGRESLRSNTSGGPTGIDTSRLPSGVSGKYSDYRLAPHVTSKISAPVYTPSGGLPKGTPIGQVQSHKRGGAIKKTASPAKKSGGCTRW